MFRRSKRSFQFSPISFEEKRPRKDKIGQQKENCCFPSSRNSEINEVSGKIADKLRNKIKKSSRDTEKRVNTNDSNLKSYGDFYESVVFDYKTSNKLDQNSEVKRRKLVADSKLSEKTNGNTIEVVQQFYSKNDKLKSAANRKLANEFCSKVTEDFYKFLAKFERDTNQEKKSCLYRMFILTPFKASFLASREYCLDLGGDLVTDTMGTSGSKYHDQLNNLVMNSCNAGYGALWVGVSDAGKNGVWRFFDGKKYDPRNEQQPAWDWVYLDDDEKLNCAYAFGLSWVSMTDASCDIEYYGLCEIITKSC